MIPQPLKWVGAVLALGILLIVVAPIAYDSIVGMVTFSDDGGLLSGDDDSAEDVDDAAEAEETGEGAEEGGDDEGEEAPDDPPDSYVVESGDTLYSIAEEVYGDGARWEEIAEANDLTGESGITEGQELVIP